MDLGEHLRSSVFVEDSVFMALHNYSGLVAPRLSVYHVWFQFTRFLRSR